MSTASEFTIVYNAEGRFAIQHFSGLAQSSWTHPAGIATLRYAGKKYFAISKQLKGDEIESDKVYELIYVKTRP